MKTSAAPPAIVKTSDTELEDIDLSQYSTASDLSNLGGDRLKFALKARGLKCGGTVQERASRLLAVKDLKDEDIPASLRSK